MLKCKGSEFSVLSSDTTNPGVGDLVVVQLATALPTEPLSAASKYPTRDFLKKMLLTIIILYIIDVQQLTQPWTLQDQLTLRGKAFVLEVNTSNQITRWKFSGGDEAMWP